MTRRPLLPASCRSGARIAAFATVCAAMVVGWGVHPAAANPDDDRIPGDHQSLVVVMKAREALDAHDRFSLSGLPGDFVAYLAARDAAASAVAAEMALDPAVLRDAWASSGLQHQEAVLSALTQLGVPYRKNTSAPGSGFDCSGLTAFAWGRAGADLTRQSGAQIAAASPRDAQSARAGDLLQYPGHVMMYLGAQDAIVHAANPNTDVELSRITQAVRYGDPAH